MRRDGWPTPSTVGRYYWYQVTSTVGFVTPIFTLFLLYRDLSFAAIATLSAVNWVSVTLGEVPTGYLGDRIGRRDSLVASTVLMAGSMVGFVLVDSFAAYVVLYVLWGLGMTFTSGSESAWLYETLRAELASEEFTRIRGRGTSIKQWTGAVAMIVGGFLYVADPTWPFVVATGWTLLGVPVLLTMPKNPGYDGGSTGETTDEDGVAASPLGGVEAVGIVRGALLEPPLRSVVVYVGLLFAAVGAANTYVQPISVDAFETHLETAVAALGVAPEATVGFLYAAFTVFSAVASYYAGDLEAMVGRRRAIRGIVPVVGVVLVVPVAVPVLAIPVFFLVRAATTVTRPMVDGYLNDHVATAGRATVLSAASMAYAVLRVPLVIAGGFVADAMGPLVAVAGLGAAILVGGLIVGVTELPLASSTPDGRAVD